MVLHHPRLPLPCWQREDLRRWTTRACEAAASAVALWRVVDHGVDEDEELRQEMVRQVTDEVLLREDGSRAVLAAKVVEGVLGEAVRASGALRARRGVSQHWRPGCGSELLARAATLRKEASCWSGQLGGCVPLPLPALSSSALRSQVGQPSPYTWRRLLSSPPPAPAARVG